MTLVKCGLSPLPNDKFIYRLDLSQAATPRLLKRRPRHRWFWFPHSYSPELVEAILDYWDLPSGSRLLDPFVGAGTTLLVAKERGISADGVDLFPLAVRITRAKVANFCREHLQHTFRIVIRQTLKTRIMPVEIPEERLQRAFTRIEYATLLVIREAICSYASDEEKNFFILALLATAKKFSRAIADGGWFRWIERNEAEPREIIHAFQEQVQMMLSDLDSSPECSPDACEWNVYQMDARNLERLPNSYSAFITSPPYPNRHDYSRVFHIELLLLGGNEMSVKQLRHSSIRSHVEAKSPNAPAPDGYQVPVQLQECISHLPAEVDKRVVRMLYGYFEDMYQVFRSARKVLIPGARLAFVVGNVRHAGVLIPVDEILADIGEQAGFQWMGTWVIRLRGNSAQQMKRFGRVPARESVVFFKAL